MQIALKAENDGNFKDAYDQFRRIALETGANSAEVGQAVEHGVDCLGRLNRIDEADAFLEAAVEKHVEDWRVLSTVADVYAFRLPHQGFIVAGEFSRGQKRGNTGGKPVNSLARDRVRSLQLKAQAMPLAEADTDSAAIGQFFLSVARVVMEGSGYSQAWRLQTLTDLGELPDYEEGWWWHGGGSRGAPVGEDGSPVFYGIPESFSEAVNDGERWRWCLEQAARFDKGLENEVLLDRADFLWSQFGVQTMQFLGPQMEALDQKAGIYSLPELPEDATIAKLATGIARIELPEEHNYILLYQQAVKGQGHVAVRALTRLAEIFQNRQQFPKAAGYWKELVDRKLGSEWDRQQWQRAYEQIVGNWGRFDPTREQTAGGGANVDYVFRNGNAMEFTARRIKIDVLLEDVKAYLKSRPSQVDWNKVNLGNIGYRLIHEDQSKYIGETAAAWKAEPEPRPNHFDRRITIYVPVEKAGAYLIEAKMRDGNTSYLVLWLNDTIIVRKPLAETTYYFVADAETGAPVSKAKLDFFGWRQERVGGNRPQWNVLTNETARYTDAQGQLIAHPTAQPQGYQCLVTATDASGRFAHLGFDHVWYNRLYDAEYAQTKAYSITDRPVYRPAQPMHYKFWVRHAQYDMPDTSRFAGKTFGLELIDPKGTRLWQKEVTADEYGGIEGDWEIPKDATLGVYRIHIGEFQDQPAPVDPRARLRRRPRNEAESVRRMQPVYGQATFRVEEYKKPEFEVTVEAPEKPVMLGEKIAATIRAKYYFGSPVVNAKVKYTITRTGHDATWYAPRPWDWLYGEGYWWFAYDYDWFPGWHKWGCVRPRPIWWPAPPSPPETIAEREVEIGPDGKVDVEIDTELAKVLYGDTDHRYSISAEVTDQSRRTIVGQGNVLVTSDPFRVYVWLRRGFYRVGDTIEASFQARTPDGKPVKGSGEAVLYAVSYEDGQVKETPVLTEAVATNEEGSAEWKLKAGKTGQYRLSYTLEDAEKRTMEGGYVFTVHGGNFDGSAFRFNDLELIPEKAEYAPGENVRLEINTDRAGSTVLYFLRPTNGVYLKPQVLQLDGKSTMREFTVVKKDMPNFFVEAVTVSGGRVHTQTKEIVVPPEKRIVNVEVAPSAETYKPGEAATVKLKLTDLEGKPFVGSTVVTIYDKALEYISGGANTQDIKEFFWKWRRHHQPITVDSASEVSGNIVPPDALGMNDLGVFGGENAAMERQEGVPGGMMPGIGGMGSAVRRGPGLRSTNRKAEADGMAFGMAMGAKGAMPAPAAAPGMAMDAATEAPAMLAEQAKGGPGMGAEGALVEPAIRTEFADTALWVGALETDADGTALVKLDMPENLTTWRIKVWAMGGGTRVGQGATDVITRKDFILRLQAPRFFVQTDQIVLSAVVHNYLKSAKTAKVSVETDPAVLRLMDEPTKSVEIPAGGETRVDWWVEVVTEGEAKVLMKALTDEDSDAMEQTFPAYLHGMLKTDSYSGVIRPGEELGEFEVTVPEQRRSEQTLLEVQYSPTLAGAMVDALPYLVSYPYGCTEQTLNRFLPTVITQKILIDAGVDLEAVREKRTHLNPQELGDARERAEDWRRYARNPVFDEEEVRAMVRTGVDRLADMQVSDGGWGWFSGWGEKSYPHTTATVVHGLQIAQANDVALPGDMLERGVSWLEQYQAEQVQSLENGRLKERPKEMKWKSHADNLDALVFMVLVDAGKKNAQMQAFLYEDRNELAVYAKAMFGLALHKLGQREQLAMIMQNIGQYLEQDDENQTAWLRLPDDIWWYWYGSEYEAQAYYLKLLSATDPENPVASRLVKYLLNNRKHATYWNSTRDTAVCIEALADYLRASGEDKPDMTVQVLLDGVVRKTVKIAPDNVFTFDGRFEVKGEALAAGKHAVQLRKEGTGPLYYNGYLTNFTLEDFITKAGLEIKVNRKYYKLTAVEKKQFAPGARGQAVAQRGTKYERTEVLNEGLLQSGDLVEVELEIDSKNDYEYLIFEDMKPSGFETVEVRSGYNGNELGAYVEFRDNRVVFFVQRLPRGKHSVTYRMRAEIPGKLSALPTRASAMYAPELKANSDELKVQVKDE